MQDTLKAPKDRVAVIIGEKGSTKKEIEKKTNTKIKVDSKEGNISIEGDNGLKILIAKNIVQAIARGFNPEVAKKLLNDDYHFEIMNINEFTRNKNDLKRVKARVIGTEGKARKMLENLTNTSIVVYGKTVSIIGKIQDVLTAKKALNSLLGGAKHGNVYATIQRERKSSEELL